MAKDLPYFKFFCSEWNDGDIALEDYEVQGLFINLCSYYWSNECNLSFSKAEKKFKDAGEDLWQTLLDLNIIKDIDNNLVITFLDEQKDERENISKKNSDAGKISAEKRRLEKLKTESNKDSTKSQRALKSRSTESQPLREEKKREEEKRKDNKKEDVILAFKSEKEFLTFFNKGIEKIFNRQGLFRTIPSETKANFKKMNSNYSVKDFKKSMLNMAKNEWVIKSSNYTPTHLLRDNNFTKYLNQSDSRPMAQGLIEGN